MSSVLSPISSGIPLHQVLPELRLCAHLPEKLGGTGKLGYVVYVQARHMHNNHHLGIWHRPLDCFQPQTGKCCWTQKNFRKEPKAILYSAEQ